MSEEFRRVLLAVSLMMLVFIGINMIFEDPNQVQPEATEPAVTETRNFSGDDNLDQTQNYVPRSEALQLSPARVTFENEKIKGSINLKGAMIDDLELKNYNAKIDSTESVKLLSPGQAEARSARFYASWEFERGDQMRDKAPKSDSIWTADNTTLTTEKPVTLSWDNGEGITFVQKISLDDNYVFTLERYIENNSAQAIVTRPALKILKHGASERELGMIGGTHEGFSARLNEEVSKINYSKIKEKKGVAYAKDFDVKQAGWLGLSEQYWAIAFIINEAQDAKAQLRSFVKDGRAGWQVNWLDDIQIIQPGGTSKSAVAQTYAGAKEYNVIKTIDERYGSQYFDRIIDFGKYISLITKPLLKLLSNLYDKIGNMGVAIIALTVIVKIILLPLAWKSYKSMAKMKTLQPKLEKLKEVHGEDRQELNKAMMELYRKEKVNPAAGCLPLLIQIPIFIALYRVLIIDMDIRHAPFFGWIKDLSVADPTSWMNLFGLLPWSGQPMDWGPGFGILSILALGAWPLMMGISMYLQQMLNPTPTDKQQAMIFKMMPIIFTFMLGSAASGLVIYWTANNILSLAQQWFITRNVKKAAEA